MKLLYDCYRVAIDAFDRFNKDDGWAIASHIALSALMALFPFLLVVTAIAGLFGSKNLADESARIMLETWPEQVAAPLAVEIRGVLTSATGGVLTIGAALALFFASAGVEALRIALNRAYDIVDTRRWWVLRLESIAYVIVAAFALLALSFLVFLAPLIWKTALMYVPELEPLVVHDHVRSARGGLDRPHRRAGRRASLAAGGSAKADRYRSRRDRHAPAVAVGGHHFRPLSGGLRVHLLSLLCRARDTDDRACVPVLHLVDLHLWRRAQQRHH